MARYELGHTKEIIRQNGDRDARVKIPVEILRFCGAQEVAADLRRLIRKNGLRDSVTMTSGIIYHKIQVEMEGPAINMIPVIEAIESLTHEEKDEEA